MLKAVIFDFDGVIVDTEMLHYKAFDHIFRTCGVTMPIEVYYDRFLGLSDEELMRTVAEENNLHVSEQNLRQLLEEKAMVFKELALAQATIIDGVPRFLAMLSDNKIAMAIYSGALLPEINMILKGAGLREFFDCVVSAEQVEKGKPHPQGFLLALEKINKKFKAQIAPAECVVVEDSRWGLEAAQAAGMHPVAITNTYPAEQLKPAEKIVANLSELTLDEMHSLCR